MKRNLLALVLSLLLLSFGLATATTTFHTSLTGGWLDGVDTRINPGATVMVTITADNDAARAGYSMPIVFTGTGFPSAVFADTATFAPAAWKAVWSTIFLFYEEAPAPRGTFPYLVDQTGVSTGAGFTVGTGIVMWTVGVTIPAGTPELSTFSVGQGNPADANYGWLWDDPIPALATTTWTIKTMPNAAPTFTNCPVQLETQFQNAFNFDFDAADAEQDPITFSLVSGPGSINPTTGAWTYQPTCANVGQSLTLVVGVTDAFHTAPTECTVTLVVNNTAPVIAGCGATVEMGIETKTVQFSVTDANDGTAAKTWSITSVTASDASTFEGSASISPTGLLTFTTTATDLDVFWTVVVRVTDCAGAFSECTQVFHTVSLFPYTIQLVKLHNVLQGHHAYLPVVKVAGSEEIWGFDFLIAYDASALSFMGAAAGVEYAIPGAYEWEYFTYRYGAEGNCGNACPSGLLRVVGLADQNDGPHHPKTKILPNDFTLFTLDFLVSNNRTLECQYVPVRFYWTDCGDNAIAFRKSTDGIYDVKTAISDKVYDLNMNPIQDYASVFPTYQGAPDLCLENIPGKPIAQRFINFINGGVDIVCADSIDKRGDVNLNGLANEIGDAVVFTNYFIAGLAAFTVNIEGQIAATDVNADGMVLSVADLVYLIRVIVGDALPYAKLSPYTSTANFSSDGKTITVDAELGAAHIVLAGRVDVSLADGAAGMEIKSGYLNGNTSVLIYSMDRGRTANGSILNTNGSIVSVEAADYNGNLYKTGLVPTTFSVGNYPNPFNPTTTISMSLPVASDWTISIFNVAGQKVTSFNGHSEAGTVNVQWDASNVASGIYFYKVAAGQYSATKKMALLK